MTQQKYYITISKDTIWDPDLSLSLVGFLIKCLSASNEEFSMTELAKNCDMSKESCFKYIKKLIDFGYATRIQDGSYEVYETKKLGSQNAL